jgi:hypothetical protein
MFGRTTAARFAGITPNAAAGAAAGAAAWAEFRDLSFKSGVPSLIATGEFIEYI